MYIYVTDYKKRTVRNSCLSNEEGCIVCKLTNERRQTDSLMEPQQPRKESSSTAAICRHLFALSQIND
jgi:hypothetical protein